MRVAARKLSAFVGRHRWAVGGVWLLVLVATLPLAAKQTENLTGGGFEVPGSESAAVDLSVALSVDGLCRTVRRVTGPVTGARVIG